MQLGSELSSVARSQFSEETAKDLSPQSFVREMDAGIAAKRRRERKQFLETMKSGRAQMALEPFQLDTRERPRAPRCVCARSRSILRSPGAQRRARSPRTIEEQKIISFLQQ